MTKIYKNIVESIANRNKLLAVLIDPDKMKLSTVPGFINKVNNSIASYIFVGGSEVGATDTEILVDEIKKYSNLPIVLFPGDIIQITDKADAILFLSLISGRNPDYLIGKHIEAVSKIRASKLDVIPTGYILIESGKETSVQRVSKTQPLSRNDVNLICDTAIAGELLGLQLIYLEAGSGASHAIEPDIIEQVKESIEIPLIVGGGIRDIETLEAAFCAGADLVVIGTAFEQDDSFFDKIKK